MQMVSHSRKNSHGRKNVNNINDNNNAAQQRIAIRFNGCAGCKMPHGGADALSNLAWNIVFAPTTPALITMGVYQTSLNNPKMAVMLVTIFVAVAIGPTLLTPQI